MKINELGQSFAAGVDAMASELLANATEEDRLAFWDAFEDWFSVHGYAIADD